MTKQYRELPPMQSGGTTMQLGQAMTIEQLKADLVDDILTAINNVHDMDVTLRAYAEAAADVAHAALTAKDAEITRLREALQWYGEQAHLCRLIHSGGDTGRRSLNDDGGKRAQAALATKPCHTITETLTRLE